MLPIPSEGGHLWAISMVTCKNLRYTTTLAKNRKPTKPFFGHARALIALIPYQPLQADGA
jgi:hypothetical protein